MTYWRAWQASKGLGEEEKMGGGGEVLGNWAEEGGAYCIVFLSSSLSLGSSYDITTATATAAEESLRC